MGKNAEVEMMFVSIVLAILMSIPIMPSSAQDSDLSCVNEIQICFNDNADKAATMPEFNENSPFFNATEYYCCALIADVEQFETECFCQIDFSIDATDFLSVLTYCNGQNVTTHVIDEYCANYGRATPSDDQTQNATTGDPPTTNSSPPSPTSDSVADTKHQPPPPLTLVSPAHSGNKTIGIAAGTVSLVVLVVVICTWLFCRKTSRNSEVEIQEHRLISNITRDMDDHILKSESLQYDFRTLEASTNNFSQDRLIGIGGFGRVYKGTLANGQKIAVKRLSENSGQGGKEFKSEIELLAKLRHRNLVSFLGCCLSVGEMMLVYEFVENKSLDNFLFDSSKKEQLNWPIRYNIIKGIAKGMLYLHDDSPTRIIHRDMKAANVLLDGDMNPRIADFGLAKISNFEQTHISTSRIAGTYGYMAPEYLMYGKMSVKSDVYSFGALVLEIVCGRRINASKDQTGATENLLSYAWRCWEERTPLQMVDPTIKDTCLEEEVIKCITIGLLSIQEDFNKRPTMAKIVHMLDSNSDTSVPSIPQRPVFMSGVFGDEMTTMTTSSTSSSTTWSYPVNPK